MRISLLLLLISFPFLLPFGVKAEIPQMISYQGKVTDSGGATVPDGSYDMVFRIYDQQTGGSALWSSGTLSVDVTVGLLSVLLGDGNPINLGFGEDYWLEVEIESDVQSPRLPMGSVGYAYMASGLVPGTVVEGDVSASVLEVTNTRTGSGYGVRGNSNGSSGRAVYGRANATTGTTYGVYGHANSTSGRGVYGEANAATGITYGVYGSSSSSDTEAAGVHGSGDNRGVYGKATDTTGTAYGGYFESSSSAGRGVWGEATATTNTTTYGGKFESASQYGRGVYGYASHASGQSYGGKFDNSSTGGIGVAGYATATSGETYGGKFVSSSPDGYGVWGKAEGTTGVCIGGYFETASSSGTAVRGIATSTTGETWGVLGRTYSTTDGSRGVYGRSHATTGTTYGGRFESSSSTGRGVYGRASHTSGATYGGKFESYSTSGIAVAGYAAATTGIVYGVYGRNYSSSDGSAGVYGRSSNDGDNDGATYGVYGRNDGLEDGFGAPPIGVYGYQSNTSSATGLGGYFVSNAINGRGVRAKTTSTSGGIGVSASGGEAGGYLEATGDGDWAFVAFSSHKILGGGSVNFVQNHPHNDDEVVVYAAPEGDEVATYTRGTARLVSGEAIVLLGETFKWVTNPDIGLTAHLTPRGDCDGLYVETLTTDEMVVRERRGGTSDVVFDYIVYGLRIGFEEATVVQKKEREAFIPSMADHREMYSANPYLRQYNALERFKAMRTASGSIEPLDLSASQALRSAIEEYDPAVHGTAMSDDVRAERARTRNGRLDRLEEHRHQRREQHAHRETEPATTDENEGR